LIKLWKYPSRVIRVETLSLFPITEGLHWSFPNIYNQNSSATGRGNCPSVSFC
jgi:hypothetical protein